MWILVVMLCMLCFVLFMFYMRLRSAVFSVCAQLDEIERGSHIELSADSRQSPLLALCVRLNRIFSEKDRRYGQYEEAEKQLKQNITSLAHDIRTPLTGAFGYVQLAQECGETDRREHYLVAAGNRMSELENMLEEMFLYTKLTNEEFTLSMKEIQALPLLGNCLLSLYSRFEELGISPETVFEEEGFWVWADEEALRRIFLNLIQNALSHGVGELRIVQRGRSLFFENPVATDSNLNPELVFERFYKADPARGKGSSGLGLFIVKELVERMGGTVRAEKKDKMFRVELVFAEKDCMHI